jgi:flagellar biosynthesis component FlhA
VNFGLSLTRLRRFAPGTDVGLALGVVALLSVLVLPLPPVLLDLGLALSITGAVLVLMVALFLIRPLDFTSFPPCCCSLPCCACRSMSRQRAAY